MDTAAHPPSLHRDWETRRSTRRRRLHFTPPKTGPLGMARCGACSSARGSKNL